MYNIRFFQPLTFLLLAGLCQTGQARADSLSIAYGRAEDIVHSFKYSGTGSSTSSTAGSAAANLSDSTWSPSFGSLPSQPEPPSPVEIALNKEVKKREQRIQKLTRTREAWRVALENLQRGKNWQSELNYWVEDSQTA